MRRFCVIFTLFIAGCLSVVSQELSGPVTVDEIVECNLPADTVAAPDSTTRHSSTRWIKQLFANGFHLNAPGVDYPRFPRFCLNVYNWGDRVFNSYDPEYVVATGKNWKLQGKSLTWGNNYEMLFSDNSRVSMMSDAYADIGGYLSFMAVSVGYMFNANKLIRHDNIKRSMINLNFTCALFTGDLSFNKTEGGVNIHRFGRYNNGRRISLPFGGVSNTSTSAKVIYFFNHRQYSHAAAYCFSKYQLRSAGTWMAGINLSTQQINIDFSRLPADMLEGLPPNTLYKYNFHYRDYYLVGGYGYSWAVKPRVWLINASLLPGIGYKHTYEDATEANRHMFTANVNAMFSAVFNHRALFVSLQGRFDANLYITNNFTFANTYENLLATVGMRF